MTIGVTETKHIHNERETYFPIKGLKFVTDLLRKEVQVFTEHFSKKASFILITKPIHTAINRVFKKTITAPISETKQPVLFLEPQLPKLPRVENEEAERLAIYKNSLFRTASTTSTKPIEPELISLLAESFDDFDISKVVHYFETHPQFASSQSLLKAIKEGSDREQKLKKIIKEKSDSALEEFSEKLAVDVRNLPEGATIYQPFTILKESLAGVGTFEKVLGDMKEKFSKVGGQFSQVADIEKKVVTSLLERKEKLKNFGKKLFPETWCNAIENSFLLDIRDIFLDTCPIDAAEKLWQNLLQHGLHGTLEKTIQEALDEQMAKIRAMGKKQVEQISSLVPPEAQALLGEFGYNLNHSKGTLEIEKQQNNTLKVTLYAKSSLLDLPGSTPLVFENVPLEKFDQELFYRLFSYQAWPEWQAAKGFSFADFTKGFIEALDTPPTIPRDEDDQMRRFYAEASPSKSSQFLALLSLKVSRQPQLFLYQLQRQALLDGWVISKDKKELLPLAKSLFLNAKKLHEQNLIASAELVKIEAAYLELSMVPSSPQEPWIDTSPIPVLKEVVVELFGEELGKAIDTVVEDAGENPGLEMKSATPAKASNSKGFPELNQFVSHIKTFRPSIYHVLRILGDVVRIAYHPILGTILGLAAHVALTLIVPGYALLGPALYLVVSKMVAQFGVEILYSILPPEMSHYLQSVFSCVREIKAHIFKRVKLAALKTFIYFAVDPKTIANLGSQAQALSQVVTKGGELSFDIPGNSIPANSIPLAPLSASTTINRPPRPYAVHPQHGMLSVNEIKNWLKTYTNAPKLRQTYLLERIGTLPIPKLRSENTFWDTLQNSEETMELLHQLIFALTNSTIDARENQSRLIVSFYSLYAIVDYLARKDPKSHLTEEYKSNPSELMLWTSSYAAQVPDAHTYQQLEKIADYFEFDLHKRYSEDELKDRSRGSLFHDKPQKSSLIDSGKEMALQSSWMTRPRGGNSTQIYNHTKSIDYRYYKEFLNDPDMLEKVEALGQFSNEFEKVVHLYMDPQTQNSANGILPQSFRTLRLIDTLAHNACHPEHYVRRGISDIHFHLDTYNTFLTIPLAANLSGSYHTPTKERYRRDPTESLLSKINPNVVEKLRSSEFLSKPGSATQMATIINVRDEANSKEKHLFRNMLSVQERINLELITAHKADMVVRALAFFAHSPDKLHEESFRLLLSHCLLNIGALQKQLKHQPSIATHIAAFFQRLLTRQNSFETHLYLVELALNLDLLHPGIIPNIKAHIREEIDKAKNMLHARELTDALISSYNGIDLEILSAPEKRQALEDICRHIFNKNWSQNSSSSATIFERWKGLLYTTVENDIIFRKQLLVRILDRAVNAEEETADVLSFLLKHRVGEESSIENIHALTRGMVLRTDVGLDFEDRIYYPDIAVSCIKATGHIFYEHDKKKYQLVSSTGLPKEFTSFACWRNGRTLIATEGTKICKTLQIEDIKEATVDLKTATHSLNLLSWIHPISKMEAFCTYENPEIISRLSLPQLDLTFTLQESGEMVCAGKFHNYFIKKKQKLPSLADIPQYLLLENPKGEKLVLIPKQSEYTSIATYLASHLAGIQLPHFVTKIAEQAVNKPRRYFVYSIGSTGELESHEPAGVANRVLQCIAKNDFKTCKKWLQKLEDLARIHPFTDEVYDQIHLAMIPLLLIPDSKWIGTGLKLAALSRANSLLLQHAKKEPFSLPLLTELTGNSQDSQRLLYWTILQVGYTHYLNQLENGAKATLEPNEEMILLQEIGQMSAGFIQNQFPLQSKVASKIFEPQLMLEQLAMSPAIVHRYHKLKTEMGEAISVREAFNYFLFLGIHAPPLERQNAEIGLLTLGSDALDAVQYRLNQATGLVSEWFKFKSANPIDKEFLAKVARVGITHLAHNRTKKTPVNFHSLQLIKILLSPCHMVKEKIATCSVKIRSTFASQLNDHAPAYFCLAAGIAPKGLTAEEKNSFISKSKQFRKNLGSASGNFTEPGLQLLTFFKGIALCPKPLDALEKYWQSSIDVHALQRKDTCTKEECQLVNNARNLEHTLNLQAKKGLESLDPSYFPTEIRNHFKQKFTRWKEQGVARVVQDSVVYGSYIYNPISIISYTRWAYNLLWAVRKVVNTTQALSLIRKMDPAELADSREEMISERLQRAMISRESAIDKIFEKILDEFFDVITELPIPPSLTSHYKPRSDDASIQAAFMRLNQSITEYASRKLDSKTVAALKTGKTQDELLKALQPLLQQYLSYEKGVMLDIEQFVNERLNAGKKRHQIKTALTFSEIENLFIKGKEPNREIQEKLYLYQVTRSRIAPLIKGKDIGNILVRKRAYSFDEVQSEKWLRAKLAFESRSGNFLWKKPMEQLKKMLQSDQRKLVLELIMASGKTYYGIPTTDYMLADQKHLLVNVWPASLAPANIQNTSLQSRLVFDQPASAARFVRHQGWSSGSVRALYQNLQAIRRNQGHYNMTQVDAQGLELKFIELLLLNKPENENVKLLTYLKESVKIVRKTGIALPDEAHEAFFCRKELNYPVGRSKSLEESATCLINEVMLCLAEQIKQETWHKIPEASFHENIKPILAKAMVAWSTLEVSLEDREECINYISGSLNYVPDFVLESSHKLQLGLLKGMLEELLPHILSKIIDVDFCKSDNELEEFAKPSAANMAPQKNSVIQNPFEAYIKTCMLTLRQRISTANMGYFLKHLQQTATAEKRKSGTVLSNTKSGKLFSSLGLGFVLENVNEENFLHIVEKMICSDRTTLEYTKAFINPKIRYFSSKISSNAQNFASMFSAFYGDTGSPYNDGTFPEGTEVVWDKGTLGETIELLQKKCSAPDSVQVLKKESPIEVLDEILQEHLGTDARAICDRGALFRGLTNIEVAKRILKKSHFQGVVFYHNNEEVIIERGSDTPIALHDSTIAKEERFTYFDQYHTFGANILQGDNALCIVTFGEDILMAHFGQAIWRMRGLKTANQSLKIVTTPAVAQAMNCQKPTIDDVITFALENEGYALAQDNFHAAKQKLHNFVRRMLLDRILDAATIAESFAIINEYKDFFCTSLEDDPFILYGMIQKELPPHEVLENYKKELLAKLSYEDQEEIREKFDTFGAGIYPEKVRASDSDLGQALEVAQNQAQAQEQEQAQEQAQEQEQNQNLHQDVAQAQEVNTQHSSIREPAFWPWPKDLDPTNTEWLKTNSPAIFPLQRVLTEAESPALQKIAQFFSPEILTTNNFTPIINRNYLPLYIPPFGLFQKPIFEILIVTENHQRKLLLLDQKEAKYWRKVLARLTDPRGVLLSLYDITLEAIVAGEKCAHDEVALQNDALFQRSIAMLKFLNGDVHYSDQQAAILSRWIQKCGLEPMKQAFRELHEDHNTAPIDGSILDLLFSGA